MQQLPSTVLQGSICFRVQLCWRVGAAVLALQQQQQQQQMSDIREPVGCQAVIAATAVVWAPHVDSNGQVVRWQLPQHHCMNCRCRRQVSGGQLRFVMAGEKQME